MNGTAGMKVLISLTALALLVASAAAGPAQEVTAEVRTWGGQSWRLAQPSLESFHTIMPQVEERAAAPSHPGATSASSPGSSSASAGAPLSGPMERSRHQPEPKHGHAARSVVTLQQDGIEIQIPLGNIASLAFFRRPVTNGLLPPYVAPTHFHYSATAVLADGSRVEGDYVSLGTTALRGMTPEGRVDIPWEEIQLLRFER